MTRKLSVRSNTSRLLATLLDNPDLPALIPGLPTTRLQALVTHLGLEDAQILLIHASAQQMTDLIESDAWHRPESGLEERFSPSTLLTWVELWYDLGVDYLVRRLRELGSELFARTLDEYVVVVDSQEVGVTGWADTLGRFCVLPKNDEHWDNLWQIIADAWSEDPELIEEVLAHVCQRRSLTIEKTYITRNENLAPDVDAARDRHRREQGYITPQSATAFLNHARRESLATLIMEQSYDPFTRMQLQRLQTRLPVAAPTTGSGSALDAVFAQIDQTRHRRLLAADTGDVDNNGCTDNADYLRVQLRNLSASQPDALRRCEREMLFLANIILEGLPVTERQNNERDAMRSVQHCCNLGLLHCLFNTPWADEDDMLAELLGSEPGLVRLFLVGFRLILEVRDRSLVAFASALRSEWAFRRLADEPDLHRAVLGCLERHSTDSPIPPLSPKQVGDLLDSLLLATDNEASEALRHLTSTLPRLPLVLEPDKHNGAIYVSHKARDIGTLADLDIIGNFLQDLERRLFV